MNLNEIVLNINNKDDFVKFVSELTDDLKYNSLTWNNADLISYLEALQSSVTDMDGWEKNLNIDISKMMHGSYWLTYYMLQKYMNDK